MKPFGILLLSGVLAFSLIVAAANCAYAAAGDLDPSFGAGGQVETNFGRTVIPSAALLQPTATLLSRRDSSARQSPPRQWPWCAISPTAVSISASATAE